MSDTESAMDKAFRRIQAKMKLQAKTDSPNPVRDLQELLNMPIPQTPESPYEYFHKCDWCGSLVTIDKYRNKLCKGCYILTYGEWSGQ